MPSKKKENPRAELKKLIEAYPSEAVDMILDKPFWHQDIKVMTQYKRESDDTDGQHQGITVIFGPDGDAWFEVQSFKRDRETDKILFDDGGHRFRTYAGGGSSLRVRAAMMFLARAIQLDQVENPDR